MRDEALKSVSLLCSTEKGEWMHRHLECAIIMVLALLLCAAFPTAQEETIAAYDPLVEECLPQEKESPSVEIDFTEHMIQACVSGDMELGRTYAELRNEKIEKYSLPYNYIDFDELHILAKVLWFEAGSEWLPQEWRIKVGEVLLNRVASPEFPDTLVECVHQEGQYQNAGTEEFRAMTSIDEKCVCAAAALLNGERLIKDASVVFQANHKLGGGVCEEMYDAKLGSTYLCYSSYPELYEGEKNADRVT